MSKDVKVVQKRKICLNCLHLCRLGGEKYKCTCDDVNDKEMGLTTALERSCEHHIGVKYRGEIIPKFYT